jgi:hypothetical protein
VTTTINFIFKCGKLRGSGGFEFQRLEGHPLFATSSRLLGYRRSQRFKFVRSSTPKTNSDNDSRMYSSVSVSTVVLELSRRIRSFERDHNSPRFLIIPAWTCLKDDPGWTHALVLIYRIQSRSITVFDPSANSKSVVYPLVAEFIRALGSSTRLTGPIRFLRGQQSTQYRPTGCAAMCSEFVEEFVAANEAPTSTSLTSISSESTLGVTQASNVHNFTGNY